MSSGKIFRNFIVLLLTTELFLQLSSVNSQRAPVDITAANRQDIPFTIEQADHLFQRKDPSGAERFILQGNVKVVRVSSRIECGSLTYYPSGSYFLCVDSVFLTDTERILHSDTLFYYVEQAHYTALGSLRWATKEFSGTGLRGDYYRDSELMAVEGRAVARDSLREIRADKLEYDYGSETLRATGNVEMLEVESGSMAVASSALYQRKTGLLTLSGRPRVTYYEADDTLSLDPYYLTSDILKSYANDSLFAIGRVRLWDDSLSITSDSLFHDRVAGVSYFRKGPPVVENPRYNLQGELLDVFIDSRRLKRINAVRNARGEFYFEGERRDLGRISADEEPAIGSWIEGDNLELYFGEEALDSIVALGNARSYFRETAESGVTYIQGTRLLLIWRDGALGTVEVTDGGRGLFLPADSSVGMTVIPDSAGFKTHHDSL